MQSSTLSLTSLHCGWMKWTTLLLLFYFQFPVFLSAQTIPQYQIFVHYSPESKSLSGSLKVTIDPQSSEQELTFILPMNRFAQKDSRGPRRILSPDIFSIDRDDQFQEDPLFPYGYDRGQTVIKSIQNGSGELLSHQKKKIPIGQ